MEGKQMLQKFLSRKFLIIIITGITDVLIAMGAIPTEVKTLLLQLVTAVGSLYVVEGIADIVSRIKKLVTE